MVLLNLEDMATMAQAVSNKDKSQKRGLAWLCLHQPLSPSLQFVSPLGCAVIPDI